MIFAISPCFSDAFPMAFLMKSTISLGVLGPALSAGKTTASPKSWENEDLYCDSMGFIWVWINTYEYHF